VSVATLADRGWARRALAVVAVLVVLSPAFAWAAGAVGYAEPLDVAAEAAGATAHATPTFAAPLPGYGVPGLGPAAGTLVAATVGTLATFGVALAVGRALDVGRRERPDGDR
jgi:cobalt/nickel transport protein